MAVDDAEDPMRCGGCAAKGPAQVLSRGMERLQPATSDVVTLGLDSPDDAALISFPGGPPLLQTVDFFRAMVDDPYLFGRIAATTHLGTSTLWAARRRARSPSPPCLRRACQSSSTISFTCCVAGSMCSKRRGLCSSADTVPRAQSWRSALP